MIAEKIKLLHEELDPLNVSLVAVSKFHPVEALQEAYSAGQRIFGESRVQEFLLKVDKMPSDTRWHFIGHLQTNKVKQIIGKTSLIESVDTERLLNLIDAESAKKGVITKVLMQVHVAAEDTKSGFYPDEIFEYFSARKFEKLTNTHICGIMGMATNTDDSSRVRSDFRDIRAIYDKIINEIAPDLRGFDNVSMGMSNDFRIAVEEGSTLVRIGTDIFGPRQY